MTTYANWVAKTAGVLTDDLGLDTGDRVASTCRATGWGRCSSAAPGWPGSRWSPTPDAELVVHGPEGSSAPRPAARLRAAVRGRSPRPVGRRGAGLRHALAGAARRVPRASGRRDDAALDGVEQAGLIARAASYDGGGERVVTDLNPVVGVGTDLFAGTLVQGGSVVWTARPDPERWTGGRVPTGDPRGAGTNRPGRTSRTRPPRSGGRRAPCRTRCRGPAKVAGRLSRASRSGSRSPSTSPAPTTQS